MESGFNEVIQNARKLPRAERPELAHKFISDLDEGQDEDVEALGTTEARKRWEAYKKGEITARPGETVLARLRGMLK